MDYDSYIQIVNILTRNYEAVAVEKYGKDVLLSTSPKVVEALSELYQSMLLTQMQLLEKEQPELKGLVAYHKRIIKLSAELEPIFTDINDIKEEEKLDSTRPFDLKVVRMIQEQRRLNRLATQVSLKEFAEKHNIFLILGVIAAIAGLTALVYSVQDNSVYSETPCQTDKECEDYYGIRY